MAVDSKAAFDYVLSACASVGHFEAVVGHEPKAAPSRTGLTGAVFQRSLTPASSGLASVSMRYLLNLRVFISAQGEAQDDMEMQLTAGVDAMLSYFIGHFAGLTGSRYVDVFGADGDEMTAQYGWIEQDSKKYRIADITIPLVLNDSYAEVA